MNAKAKDANMKALQFTKKHRFSDASAIIFDLLKVHSIDDLHQAEYANLWCVFCEEIADNLSVADRLSLIPLYKLASMSYAKEGTLATDSGEGISAQRNIRRVEAKIQDIRSSKVKHLPES